MNIDQFNGYWYSAFGWKLTEANGVNEWAAFVGHAKSNDRAIRETLRDFSDEYNRAKSEGKANYKDRVPTLDEFKTCYFTSLPERKRRWDAEQRGMRTDGRCLVCGGGGIVWTLAPQKDDGDRRKCPEDWRTVGREGLYPFAEARHCPLCCEGAYHGDHDLRNKVQKNCLPETVDKSDPRNPFGYPVGGDKLIRDYLADKYGSMIAGGPAAPHRLTPEEIAAEKRRMFEELAAKFGPIDESMKVF